MTLSLAYINVWSAYLGNNPFEIANNLSSSGTTNIWQIQDVQGPKIGCICGWFPQLCFGYMWTYIYIYIYYDDDNRPILEIGWNFIFCENAYVFPWDMATMVWNWLVNLYVCVCVCVLNLSDPRYTRSINWMIFLFLSPYMWWLHVHWYCCFPFSLC